MSPIIRGETISAYSWRVWAAWVALAVLLGAACVVLAAGSPDVDKTFFLAIFWFFGAVGTAGYFEIVNSRHRSPYASYAGIALTLALTALGITVVFVLFGGPPGLALAYLAWRRFRKTTERFPAGLASAAVAFSPAASTRSTWCSS